MSTSTPTTGAITNELEKSLEFAAKGTRDPDRMRKAIEELDRSRKETRKKIGIMNVAVDLIRDARDP